MVKKMLGIPFFYFLLTPLTPSPRPRDPQQGKIRLFYDITKIDMAEKRHKKHKNESSGLVISMCCNEQKSKF